MSLSRKFPIVLVAILILISLTGLFEKQAFTFVSGVFEKNLKFMGLASEIKLVISGVSSLKLPFVEGATRDINDGMTKVIEYLLITDIISFLQVLLLSISKSWILKSMTIILFLLSFVDVTKAICTKLLVLSLALSPGLAIYSIGVQKLAQETSIDFGEKYLKKLEVQVNAVKANKAELMKQHQKDLTKIKNGEKGVHLLQKFREDVAYDFKRVKNDIKGAHAHIRLFIHEAGHEMKSKIYGFCSMVLFCMAILPLGYALIIYMLVTSLFKINSTHIGALHNKADAAASISLNKPSFGSKMKKVFDVYLKEFHSIQKKVEQSPIAEQVEGKIDKIEQKAEAEEKVVKEKVGDAYEKVESEVSEEVSQVQSEVKEKAQEMVKPKQPPTTQSPEKKVKKGSKPNTLSI